MLPRRLALLPAALYAALNAPFCLAQAPGGDAGKSPQVLSDGRVIFRLKAPGASDVSLWGDWITRFNASEKLEKNDAGLWSVTVEGLSPGRHAYLFLVDGIPVPDPQNFQAISGRDGFEANLVAVPGEKPLPDDERNVPHGSIHRHWYESSTGLGQRSFLVYTPPGYGTARNASRYPLLVLLHGSGGTETAWMEAGFVNFIADNLIAEGRMRPMLIVLPNGHSTPPGGRDDRPDVNADRVEHDLLRDVLPAVESAYRVQPGRRSRAIAGASMGGFQALAWSLRPAVPFGSIGIFSAGAHEESGRSDVQKAGASGRLKDVDLFWVGVGSRDPLLKDAQALDAALTETGVPHEFALTPEAGHTWLFWRKCLADFLPRLFNESGVRQPAKQRTPRSTGTPASAP